MPSKFKIHAVTNAEEWQSNYGPMVTWTLDCGDATIQVNSKPNHKYKAGDEFYAEYTGKEYKGVKRYKRVKPPDDAPAPSQSSGKAPTSHAAPAPKPMDYEQASLLLKRCLDDFGPTAFEPIFRLIVDGKIENPIKPKTTVRDHGNTLETAGVTQLEWDFMMPLCERYTQLTDRAALRSLLIATCQVQTRKDLTKDNAALFIEALRMAIASEEAKQAPPPTDADYSPEDF